MLAPFVPQIVAVWLPGVTWDTGLTWHGDDPIGVIVHAIHRQSPTVSTQTALYSAMELVSSNGAICNLPFMIGDPGCGCECYIQDI